LPVPAVRDRQGCRSYEPVVCVTPRWQESFFKVTIMSQDSRKPGQLIEQGRQRIVRAAFLFGVPLLIILVTGVLQYGGSLRLQEYFLPERPETMDPGTITLALALTALLLGCFGTAGVVQGLVWIRRGKSRLQRGEVQ
jgi:hypothetical protein